jgi:ribosomal protein S2
MSVVLDLVKANVFVGQPKNKSNPKTSDNWLDIQNGMVVFDPNIIADQLESAKKKLQEAKKSNKQILVLCEKSLYKEELEILADKA